MSNLKKLFKNLQADSKSILFIEEKINYRLLKKLTKSMSETDKKFVNLFNSHVDFLDDEKKTAPIKTTFVEKKKVILTDEQINFDGLFQLLDADIENLEFLGKSTADPKYCHLFIDLFTSKVYVYIMKSRKSIASKKEISYREVETKKKVRKQGFLTDRKFEQKKIYDLNKKYNIDMFSTAVRGEKASAEKQKLREPKKRIFRFKALEKKVSKRISPYEIIKKSVDNMNSLPTAKYKQVTNDIKKIS